jgi:diguanylate cyclase (GGDEF)-like protein
MSTSGDTGSLCMISDVSTLRRGEASLSRWAMRDALTGLPNRTLLMDRIQQALARSPRDVGDVVALFCDLDGFNAINDSLGHSVGDEVLQVVAERLRSASRTGDNVAMIGGDEFVVLSENIDPAAASGLAARVLEAVAHPLFVAGHEVSLSVSVGIAVPGPGGRIRKPPPRASWLAETFTAICSTGPAPTAPIQSASCRQAVRSTHAPMSPMRFTLSARVMKASDRATPARGAATAPGP